MLVIRGTTCYSYEGHEPYATFMRDTTHVTFIRGSTYVTLMRGTTYVTVMRSQPMLQLWGARSMATDHELTLKAPNKKLQQTTF